MKKIALLSLFTFVGGTLLAQSVSISPNNLQIPSVSALPGCAAADYGKIVFLTTTSRANVCGSSGWIEVSAGGGGGSLTLPYSGSGSFSAGGFSVLNTGGGINSAGIQGMTSSAINGASGVLGNAFETTPTGNNAGVRGLNSSTNTNGSGVFGSHAGGGYGVYGASSTGPGVYGVSTGTANTSGYGVFGYTQTASGIGVYGEAAGNNATAVWGKSTNINGVGGAFQNTAGGFAISTFGKVRFQGNGAAVNKILTSIDANGTAEWKDIIKSEVLKLSAAAFHPHLSTNGYVMGSQGIHMTGSAGSFHADVSLPNGATINSFKIYYIDNDGASPSTGLGITGCALQQITHTGAAVYAGVASITVNNTVANANIQSQNVFPSIVVDNDANSYRVVVSMPASANVILVAVEIGYTYKYN
ncbi:MAG: hypothetical protein MUF45_11715 [Spirosomaceae bacterium]|nr:hypothetical protein [Spirosomataceae bacterium]